MMNQITLKDYEQRVTRFDFQKLVENERPEEIARAVIVKVKNNPLMSEFFVRVVLSKIGEAYSLDANNSDQGSLLFFDMLLTTILDTITELDTREDDIKDK